MKWPKSLTAYLATLRGPTQQEVDAQRQELVRRMPAPTFWLFGKTGSGKSSLVRLLTQADQIQIGNGLSAHHQADRSLYASPIPTCR